MTLLLPLIAFVFASVLVGVAALKFVPKSAGAIDRRLGEVTGSIGASTYDSSANFERVAADTLKRLANVAPRSSASERSKLQVRLVNAGYRNTEALVVFAGIRVASALLGFSLVATPLFMGKSELFSHFAERFEVKRTQAREFFDELAQLAEKELKKSGEFVLPGMVKLVVQKRKARMGRNPATGEAIKIPAKTVVKARITKQLKDAVLPRK